MKNSILAKLFCLYSLENAVYFGVKQYFHIGEKAYFGNLPEWTAEVDVFDGKRILNNDLNGFDKAKKSFCTVLSYTKYLSPDGFDLLLGKLTEYFSPDSSGVFEIPDSIEYRKAEKIFSKYGFLIYEHKRFNNEESSLYLAVKKT